jgi:RNase P/RNase MRP subunit p30
MRDIVFPKNNEEKFIEIAERLGYRELIFVYKFNKKTIDNYKDRIDKLKQRTTIKLFFGILAEKKCLLKVKKYSDFVFYKSDGNDRFIFDKVRDCFIFGLEEVNRKDSMHYRNSGLNQVHCKLANKNNITITFSFTSLLKDNKIYRSQILGRMMQNIRFCRKYKVKTIIASFTDNPYGMRSYKDLESFGRLLGMFNINS